MGESGFHRAMEGLSFEQPSHSASGIALQTARTWLREARQPLVVLSGSLENEAVLAAVRLAKQAAAILVCDEECTGSLLGLSMQAAGLLTATLGDLRSLDTVVLCAVDPVHTHPRLAGTIGHDLAAESIRLEPPDPLEALRWLRLAGLDSGENIPTMFAELAARIRAARFGLLIFGPEWVKKGQPFTTEFLLWHRDLNAKIRWYALYLPSAANSTGVVETLLSETGYPGNMRFGLQGIDYSPPLWQADSIIRQGGADLCLLVGQPSSFSRDTLTRLSLGRTILLDPDQPAWNPPVWLQSARAGVDSSGRVQRLDGVPVDLQPMHSSQRVPITELLMKLTRGELA